MSWVGMWTIYCRGTDAMSRLTSSCPVCTSIFAISLTFFPVRLSLRGFLTERMSQIVTSSGLICQDECVQQSDTLDVELVWCWVRFGATTLCFFYSPWFIFIHYIFFICFGFDAEQTSVMKHIEVWNVASQWHRPQEEYLNHTTLSAFFFNSSFCFPGSIFKRKHLRRFSQHCFQELPATCHRRSHAGSIALSAQSAGHVGTELSQMPFLTNGNRKLKSAKQAPNACTWGTGAKVFLVTSCTCSTSCCL